MSRSSSPQITSKGCSRGFILCVLYRALDYARQRQMLGHTVQFPFCNEEIRRWLLAGQGDCAIAEETYQAGLGGTYYDELDTSTYWTQPQQFCTWWKNNVERKNKFMLLQRDAAYDESDEKQIARAAYCRNAIAISLSIKNNFHRYLPSQGDTNIVQYIIPYPMPAHMTTPSFFSHDPANAENDSGVPICQPTARGSSSPVIPPPAVARRVKRPYNKKPPQPRLPPATCTPRSSSPSAPSSVVGFAAQMTQIPSSNTSIPAYPVMPETCPSASYTQPSQSSSVTEEASSDSGTDDDSYFKCDDLFKLSEAHDVSARVGSKRKAENRTSPTTPITPTKTKLKARASQSAASAYALSYQSNTFSVSYPTVQTFENTFTSYCPSYSGQTAFPINTTHTQLSDYTNCSASVPADFHTHEYYCVEDETAFPTTPSYAQYDDDHICYGLKLPEDPYILELSQGDFGDFQIQDSYKYQGLAKVTRRALGVVSPMFGEEEGLFKPIGSLVIPLCLSPDGYSTPRGSDSSPSESPINASHLSAPKLDVPSLRVPSLYPTNRATYNTEKYLMASQTELTDDGHFFNCQLPCYTPTQEQKKVESKAFAPPGFDSPFFSVSRRFEEDLSSLLIHGSISASLVTPDKLTDREKQVDTSIRDSRRCENACSADCIDRATLAPTSLLHSQINDPGTQSDRASGPHTSVSTDNTYKAVTGSLPSVPTSSSTYTAELYSTDLADYSLLDDGDDEDLLSFLGYRNSSWVSDDFQA